MNQIRPWLYIGNYRDTIDHALLADEGITAILQLAAYPIYPDSVNMFLPVEDGAPLPDHLLRVGLDFIRQHHADKKILVACAAGISRSATFCIAALHEVEQLSLADAYRAVKQARSIIIPHYALWDSMCGYFGEQTSYRQVVLGFE